MIPRSIIKSVVAFVALKIADQAEMQLLVKL
jgi:hypothetical protein